jgi:hypothetical protein
MRPIFISKKTKETIYQLWRQGKTKTEIEKYTGICRKKVSELIRINECQEIFDVKRQKNWLIND